MTENDRRRKKVEPHPMRRREDVREPEWIRRMHAGEFVGKEVGVSGWSEAEKRFAWGDR